MHSSHTTPSILLSSAIHELPYLNKGEVFLVKDLFKGYIWNRIEINERLRLGALFIDYINNNPSLNVKVLDKTSSNQQRYKKL